MIISVIGVLLVVGIVGNSLRSDSDPKRTADPQQVAIEHWKVSLAANKAKQWPTAEQPVIDAYRGYLSTLAKVSNPPQPFTEDMKQYATGDALENVALGLLSDQKNGIGSYERPNGIGGERIDSVKVNGATAVLESCAVDDGYRAEIATGKVVNDRVATLRSSTRLDLVDGVWKVAYPQRLEDVDGVSGCAG